jgi:hypothetical protein
VTTAYPPSSETLGTPDPLSISRRQINHERNSKDKREAKCNKGKGEL